MKIGHIPAAEVNSLWDKTSASFHIIRPVTEIEIKCPDPNCKSKFKLPKIIRDVYFDMMAEAVTIKCPVCKKVKTYRRLEN
jgi:phage FluMu protein Com